MPLNRRTADDAILEGFMQFQGWSREFVEQWNEPVVQLEKAKRDDQAMAAFEMMPEEMRTQLQTQYPEQYAAAKKAYQKLKGGKNISMVGDVSAGNAGSYFPGDGVV